MNPLYTRLLDWLVYYTVIRDIWRIKNTNYSGVFWVLAGGGGSYETNPK
jgi:hypothetical protein